MSEYEYKHEDQDGDTLLIDMLSKGVAVLRANSGYAGEVSVPAEKVDEIYHALRKATGLPEVWVVEKADREISDTYTIATGVLIKHGEVAILRSFVEHLLCCEDKARKNVKRLPTAVDSVIKLYHSVFVRTGGGWTKAGSTISYPDDDFVGTPFTILHDAGAGNE